MKKRFFLTIIALLILLFAGLGVHYLLSLRKVTLNLDEQTDEVTVYTSRDKVVKQLSSDGRLLLKEGEYYVIPTGANIAPDKISFSVTNQDMTIDIQPAYTKDFLANLLKNEVSAIEAAIVKKYPSALKDYTLAQGSLYARGEWYGALLKPKIRDIREQKDPYRIILHKNDGMWEVVRRPEYSLSSSRYSEVPIDILRKVNAIVGEPGN